MCDSQIAKDNGFTVLVAKFASYDQALLKQLNRFERIAREHVRMSEIANAHTLCEPVAAFSGDYQCLLLEASVVSSK
jgi:hypothetical protein